MHSAFALLLFTASLSAQRIAIRNVTAIDADGARPNVNVIVSGGRVMVASAKAAIPAGAAVIDGRGKYLIPGLWDMHVHLWETNPMSHLYVANGVLGVRDMGSDYARTSKLRSDILTGQIPGPRIYTSGPVIDGPRSGMKQAPVLTADTPEEARQAVDSIDKASGDFVKILSGLSFDAYQAVAQRSRVIRMPFAGHLPDSVTMLEAIDARQKSIEHMFGLAVACSPLEPSLRSQRADAIAKKDRAALVAIRQRTYDTFSPGAANQLFHRMARFGVWQTPTLTLWRRMSLIDTDRLATASELRFVPQSIRASWADPRKDLEGVTPERLASFRKDYEFHRALVKLLFGSGAGVLAGTDTGDPYVVPGFALHDELEALVEAGVSPLDALTSATLGPARFFETESSFGKIARGKVADLVLLNANPLTDIRNTRRISAVILNGSVLDRRCLDQLLEGKNTGCPSVSLTPKPAPSSAPRRASSRRRVSRTR
ncbi:MAG: amidohydrolase family protein [Bryobacteraceae bacterium]|nr:amidohydrolase family protein [Bryobacteraceae bacterium]